MRKRRGAKPQRARIVRGLSPGERSDQRSERAGVIEAGLDAAGSPVQANEAAPEPPEKWAIFHRLRIAGKGSPLILQIREYLMDILAYRDDSHISAAHPHFGRAGIAWLILGLLCRRETLTAEQAAEILSLRGYETSQYEIALQAAVQIGWAQEEDDSGRFSITQKGTELHAAVERLTDEYFYAPWAILVQAELDELYGLLLKLR